MAYWVENSLIVRETWVQSQVESYQRLKKWYLIPPCLTLSNVQYVSRVKWSNPGKGVALSSTLRCSSYRKGSLRVALDYSRQLYLLTRRSVNSDQQLKWMVVVQIEAYIDLYRVFSTGHSVCLHEKCENIIRFIKLLQNQKQNWIFCVDHDMVCFLLGQQRGYTK